MKRGVPTVTKENIHPFDYSEELKLKLDYADLLQPATAIKKVDFDNGSRSPHYTLKLIDYPKSYYSFQHSFLF